MQFSYMPLPKIKLLKSQKLVSDALNICDVAEFQVTLITKEIIPDSTDPETVVYCRLDL